MPVIHFNNQPLESSAGENVLDVLIRNGIATAHSCKAGICQSCMMRCTEGDVPAVAQKALKPNLRALGYFLSCQCAPDRDMKVELPDSNLHYVSARLIDKKALSRSVIRLQLETETPVSYHAGQFISLKRRDGVIRSYSLASLPGEDTFLELHVKRMPGGDVSNWLADSFAINDHIDIGAPLGECFYSGESNEQPLLLVGTGTGIAPLTGVLRDALRRGHGGPIRVYHGAASQQELYLDKELKALAQHTPQLDYLPCISSDAADNNEPQGRACDTALIDNPTLAGWKIFLCGAPPMVKSLQQRAYLAGASLRDIHADPFESSSRHKLSPNNSTNEPRVGACRYFQLHLGCQIYRPDTQAFMAGKAPLQVPLMAKDEMAVFSLHSGRDFAALVAAHLGIEVGLHEEHDFADGEHKIRPLQSVRDRDVYVVQSLFTDCEYSLNDRLVRLLCLLGVLRENGAGRVTAVIPYLCYSRKERKTKARDPVTSRYIAQLFEAMKLDRIVTLDAHSSAGFDNAFRCNSERLSARGVFIDYLLPDLRGKNITVASPDVGGIKRAEQFREALQEQINTPVSAAFMEKYRSGDRVSGSNVVGHVRDRTVLIVDDMIVSGSTLKRAADAFRESGATEIIGIATHGNFSATVAGVVKEPTLATSGPARILVSNSISPRLLPDALYRNTIEVVDVSPLIGDAIYRLHHRGLVSQLEH